MTEIKDLVAAVGEHRFRRACGWASRYAAGIFPPAQTVFESIDKWPTDVTDVPHELSDLVWESKGSWLARVELAFQLYRAMPCYATLMYGKNHFSEWDGSTKKYFWDQYRSLLSDADDRLGDPVAYSLWCDYFEDPDTVEEAWAALASPHVLSERGLERILEVSGPVPYAFKAELCGRLENTRWHPFIFRSLHRSAFDVCGQIDANAAREVLSTLSLPQPTEGFEDLVRELDALRRPKRERMRRFLARTRRREPRDRTNPKRG
jgi:hypothetical protein